MFDSDIDVYAASALIQENHQNPAFEILDVRTPEEFDAGYIKNSKLIDYYGSDFVLRLKELDKSKIYLIYCRSGNRSGKTLFVMDNLGFKNIYNMLGGVEAWTAANLELVTD